MIQIPDCWLNLVPLLPNLPHYRGDMSVLQKVGIPGCLEQEFSSEKYISIPGPVMDDYLGPLARPRPLWRAVRLERKLGVYGLVEIYIKNEGLPSPTGSHKTNTSVAQAHYAQEAGFRRIVTETGAGQWGTAVAFTGARYGKETRVFWVRAMHDIKPERRDFMRLYDAEVFASPSNQTVYGRRLLEQNPNHPGSLDIAISEGLEDAMSNPGSCYMLGSVLNHVLLHQSIIGLEAYQQLVHGFGVYPDLVVACFGGGSNFGGLAGPFLRDALEAIAGGRKPPATRFIAAQSETAPNLTGEYGYAHPDETGLAPELMMYHLPPDKKMSPIFADGLRYKGSSPMLSHIKKEYGLIEPMVFPKNEKKVFQALRLIMMTEGIMAAPESGHAAAAVVRLARQAQEENLRRVILVSLSGHGLLDMAAYRKMCLAD